MQAAQDEEAVVFGHAARGHPAFLAGKRHKQQVLTVITVRTRCAAA